MATLAHQESAFDDPRVESAAWKDGVWIVIAAYNEGRRLGRTLESMCEQYPNIVVVDDGSTDNTYEIALEYPVWALRHLFNCGQGAALQTGIDFAVQKNAQIVVTFDADGQHDVNEIEAILEPVREGRVEAALGSRFLGQTVGMPFVRRVVLKAGVLFTWMFSRISVSDTHNGFRALSRRAAQTIRITQNRMAHASEILDQIREHGLSYCEVPVTIHYTDATMAKGQSSWNALKIVSQLLLGKVVR